MISNSKIFMSEQLNSNKFEDDEFNLNTEEKISKTKGCLFSKKSFFLEEVFIKNLKFI